MFERFRQAEAATTRQHGGLELGLAIADTLVEPMAAPSARGATARERGVLQREFAGAGRGPGGERALEVSSEIEHPSVGTITRLDGLRVLVVDDEPDARELVTMVLHEQAPRRTRSARPRPRWR